MLDQSFNLSDSNVLDDIFQLPTLGVGSGLGRSDLITPFVRKSLQGLDSDFLSNSLEEYQLELKNRWQSSESLSSWPQDGDFLTGQSSFVGLFSSVDLAGNTLATARAITVGSSTTSYTDWVGSTDTNDYYSFSLANSSNFNLGLTGMTADGDVQLLNSSGSVIASSTNGGTASESITRQLSAGTYYIRVYPYQSANTNYNLAVSATSGGGGTGFNSTYGYGLVNAAAAVAQAISQPTFADVPNLGGNNWGNDMVNAPEAWARGYTGQGVTVAVIDSGVDISHQDLSNNIWGNTGEIASNGIDDDGNGYTDDVYGWNFGIGQNNNNVLPGTSSSGAWLE